MDLKSIRQSILDMDDTSALRVILNMRASRVVPKKASVTKKRKPNSAMKINKAIDGLTDAEKEQLLKMLED
jgi:hypothetical protein